jgi:hypothetical protein
MNKPTVLAFFFKSSLASILLLTTLSTGFTRRAKTLAECTPNSANCENKTSNVPCSSRNPYNLTTSVTGVHKIQVSWDVCQKNDFYQVSWSDNKNDIEKINDPTARSWTYTRARDLAKYTFKVRGCNASTKESDKNADCTPWSEVKVQAPDW